MRQARVKRSVFAIAILLNILGSPMAWAQWLDTAPSGQANHFADIESAPCHGHEAAAADQPSSAPGSMPCCEDGNCTCAVPALFIFFAGTSTRAPRPSFIAQYDTSTLPAHPFDDALRPPIR